MLAIEDQLIDHSFTYLNSCQIYNYIVTAESDLNDCGGLMMSVTVLSGSFGLSDHRLQ